MKELKAVVFDIDGTLAPEVSWLALTRDLGASVEQHIRIYDDYKEDRADYQASKTQLLSLWRATGNANKEFFGRLFEALPLDSGAQKVVQTAKLGRIVCLITGSMDLYAQAIAQRLGVDDWHANTILYWDQQGVLQDMDYELRQADRKLEQFMQFCSEHGLAPEDCMVVGDSENDEKLFRACQRGVLIGGDVQSETYAWRRIAKLADLENILLEK